MLTKLKKVAISFLYVCKIFIKKMDCSETLFQTLQQLVAEKSEKLHYIRKKVAILKEQYFATRVLSSLIID